MGQWSWPGVTGVERRGKFVPSPDKVGEGTGCLDNAFGGA